MELNLCQKYDFHCKLLPPHSTFHICPSPVSNIHLQPSVRDLPQVSLVHSRPPGGQEQVYPPTMVVPPFWHGDCRSQGGDLLTIIIIIIEFTEEFIVQVSVLTNFTVAS